MKEVVPEWRGDDIQVTLNKVLVCNRHRDRAKKEHFWILCPGDCSGGTFTFDDGTKVKGKKEWHKIGGHIHHWNDPHEGTKYSTVLCRHTRNPNNNRLVEAKWAKHEKSLQV